MITGLLDQTRRRLTARHHDPEHPRFWQPGTTVPRGPAFPAPPPRRPIRIVLYAVAATAGAVFLYAVSAPAVEKFLGILANGGTATPVVPASADKIEHTFVMNTIFMVLAAIVVVCLYAATDERTVGLVRPRRGPHHRVALGFYLRTAGAVMPLTSAVFLLAAVTWPQLTAYVGVSDLPALFALDLQRAVAAGWCEEIIATLLVWVVLERIPASRGRSIADTGWGTATVILVHLSYHLSMGIRAVLLIAPVYFTVLCWRHTRSLPAVIIGHVIFDVVIMAFPTATSVVDGLVTMAVQAAGFFLLGSVLDHRWFTTDAPLPPDAPAPPVVRPVAENLSGLLWPRIDVQPAVRHPTWPFWKLAVLGVAIAWAVAPFTQAILVAVPNIGGWFTGDPLLRPSSHPPLQQVIEVAGAVVIVGLLAVVAGPRAVGVRRTGRGEVALMGGYALRGPYFAHVTVTTSITLLIALLSTSTIPSGGAPPHAQSTWWIIALGCVHAGVVETVSFVVLPYLLLEQIRTKTGTPIAHTWIGTTLIVALWIALHSSRGLMVFGLLPVFYFQVILWRHTKYLPVLMAFHIVWDVVEYLVPWIITNYLVFTIVKFNLVALGALWETRGARRATDAAELLAQPSRSTGQGDHTTTGTISVAPEDRPSPHRDQPLGAAAPDDRSQESTADAPRK